jgi:hypothetical protein
MPSARGKAVGRGPGNFPFDGVKETVYFSLAGSCTRADNVPLPRGATEVAKAPGDTFSPSFASFAPFLRLNNG